MISSPSTLVWLVIFLFAVIGLARLAPMAATLEFGGTASRLAAGRRGAWPIPRLYLRALSWQQVLARLLPVGEACAVLLWAMWVGRAYLCAATGCCGD